MEAGGSKRVPLCDYTQLRNYASLCYNNEKVLPGRWTMDNPILFLVTIAIAVVGEVVIFEAINTSGITGITALLLAAALPGSLVLSALGFLKSK